MKQKWKGDSQHFSIMSADDIRHFCGPVADHTVSEILALQPTSNDLEVAITYAQGEGSIAGVAGHALSGTPARIYEILASDEAYQNDER
jgi:hypothetical protein